jgi:hypothetical protein
MLDADVNEKFLNWIRSIRWELFGIPFAGQRWDWRWRVGLSFPRGKYFHCEQKEDPTVLCISKTSTQIMMIILQRVQPLLCSRWMNNPFLGNGSLHSFPRQRTMNTIELLLQSVFYSLRGVVIRKTIGGDLVHLSIASWQRVSWKSACERRLGG